MRGYGVLEDVPMIVPIVLALLIFFGALSWATGVVNKTNERVDTILALIRVADAFTQWGVITDQTWDESCDAIRTKEQDVGFVACLVGPGNVKDVLEDLRTPGGGLNPYACPSLSCTSPGVDRYLPRRTSYVLVRYFPVTYQVDMGGSVRNDVNFLVVAVWPKG